MSDLEVEAARQQMAESGELEFIYAHTAAEAGDATAPAAPAADTVTDEPVVEEVKVEEAPAAEAEEAPLTPEEEEVLYLELDDDTQALIDNKYGGDINKALAALVPAQSTIGRQGNELGELRKQIEEGFGALQRGLITSQPYPEFPDEYAEPSEAAMQYRAIAELAFDREDVDMFGSVVDAWIQVDPLSATTYRDLKILQLQTSLQASPTAAPQGNPQETIAAGVKAVQEEFPQMLTPEFTAAMEEELQKFPSLKGLLWGEIPGTTPEQRISALRETVQRVASRQVGETEEKARRRVAVTRSEAARQARVEAKVAAGQSARVAEPEVEARTVPLGETGRSLDIDRLNAMLSPEDRI